MRLSGCCGHPSSSSSVPPTTPGPTPGDVVVGTPVVPGDLVAGGGGALTVPMSNPGDTPAPPVQVDLGLPAGVSVGDATMTGPGSALRATGAAFRVDDTPVSCAPTGTGSICTVPAIPARTDATLQIRLTVDSAAADGPITVTMGGRTYGGGSVVIGPGYQDITLTPTDTSMVALSNTTLQLRGIPAAGSTAPGTVTFPVALSEDLIVTAATGGCRFDTVRTAVECTPDAEGVLVGEVQVAALSASGGAVSTTAQLPGGRTLAIDVTTPTVTPRGPADPMTLTGPFDAAAVGGATMRCNTPDITRSTCGTTSSYNTTNGIAMERITPSFTVPTPPKGSTVVSAVLTLVTTARDPAASAPTITVGAGAATTIDGPRQQLATGTGIEIQAIDITELTVAGRTVADLLASGPTVSVSDPQAVLTTTVQSPLSAWTLTVVWSDPAGPTRTVELRNTGSSSLTGTAPQVELLGAGGRLTALWVAAVAVDPWADKAVLIGGSAVGGFTGEDLSGSAGSRHDGFDLVNVDEKVLAGSGGEPVMFRNIPAVPAGPNPNDQVWIGPVLAVRHAG